MLTHFPSNPENYFSVAPLTGHRDHVCVRPDEDNTFSSPIKFRLLL